MAWKAHSINEPDRLGVAALQFWAFDGIKELMVTFAQLLDTSHWYGKKTTEPISS